MAIPVTRTPVVLPSTDHVQLRCRCGHMDFGAHVRPLPRGGAVLVELICRQCAFVLKVRPIDMGLERTGEATGMNGERL